MGGPFFTRIRAGPLDERGGIPTDEELYDRFLAHHRESDLKSLLERHRESLTLFLYGYVRSMEDAEELMLDAFAQVACGRSVFSGKSSFKTWLFSVGRNLALMRLRKRRLTFSTLEEITDETAEPPELALLSAERNRQLYLAMEGLKEEYRRILLLLYFEDMTHEEAARVMGKSLKQIYHLTERGKSALRTNLERMGFEI